jgi:hypothetical protein
MSMLFTNNNHINLNQGLKEAIICVTNSLKIETVVAVNEKFAVWAVKLS